MEFEKSEEPKESEMPEETETFRCNYCGCILELAYEIWLDPDTGQYEYACPHCAKMLAKKGGFRVR